MYITPYILNIIFKNRPGKYLPCRIYKEILQNVGHNIDNIPQKYDIYPYFEVYFLCYALHFVAIY